MPGDLPSTVKAPLTMTTSNLHPCAKLYLLQRNLETLSQEQLKLAADVAPLCDLPELDAFAEHVSMVSIVLAGMAKRLQEIRHEVSRLTP